MAGELTEMSEVTAETEVSELTAEPELTAAGATSDVTRNVMFRGLGLTLLQGIELCDDANTNRLVEGAEDTQTLLVVVPVE